jgi:hypothetical protein
MTHIVLFHGDDQGSWSDVPFLLDRAKAEPTLDAILGSRFLRGARPPAYSLRRWAGNLFFNGLVSLLLRRPISDIGSGLNLYALAGLDRELLKSLPDHIAFDLRLLLELHARKKNFMFLPIHWKTTDQRSTVRDFEVGIMILREILRHYRSILRLRGTHGA